MRFRTNIENVNTFYHLIQSVATLQKRCILRFTETTLHIICRDHLGGGSADPGGGGSGIEVWSQVKAASLFTDYRIQSNAGNEISLLLASDALLAALRAAAGADAHTVVMKLAKKHELAVLTIELTLHARLGADAVVAHDVRIEVQKPADMERLKEPLCPEPDVHILLPPLSKVRTTVERMRSLSDVIAFRANNRGRMQLAVRTDSVAVEIQWTSLTNPKMDTGQGTQSQATDADESTLDPEEMAVVHVSVRTLMKFLGAHVVGGTTIAAVCQHHCIIFYVYLGDSADAGGVLAFYIPGMVDD